MKKLILAAVLVASLCLCGCNAQIVDTTYSFDTAMVWLPDGSVIQGEVTSWKDYADSDAIQVKIDGVTYYTHLLNVVLMSE